MTDSVTNKVAVDESIGVKGPDIHGNNPNTITPTTPTIDTSSGGGSLVPIVALLLLTSIGSYLSGLYRWSIWWPILILVGVWLVIRRRIQRFFTYHRHALERGQVKQKLERHVETTEWLNHSLERFWTVLEPFISIKVIEQVNTLLENNCPGFLNSIQLTEFTLGSTPPLILGVVVHPQTAPNIVHLDAEVCFIPNEEDFDPRNTSNRPDWNLKVVLATRIGKGYLGVDIPILLKELTLRGKLRVQLELAPNTPFISKIQISLLEQPEVDFILKPLKSFDLMDLPGLSSWLFKTIQGALADVIVDPNFINIPIARSYSEVQSIGIIKIMLKQIRGVKMTEQALPFVKMQVGGKLKGMSGYANHDTSEWNTVHYLLVHSLKAPLTFLVMLESALMGSVSYSVTDIEQDAGTTSSIWRTIVGRESSKIKGELNFGAEYYPAAETPDPEADINFESGIVQITIHQFKDIAPESEKKSCYCYYEVYVHGIDEAIDPKEAHPIGCYYRSKTRKKTVNPTWDEVYEVFLEHKNQMGVTVLARHEQKNDAILGRWTAGFNSLMNRTDWFQFGDTEGAQLFGSFIFRPVRIDLTGFGKKTFVPSLGMIKVHLTSADGFKASKTDYYVSVDINGRSVGRTQPALSSTSPVWNKTITALVRDNSDNLTLDVLYGDSSRKLYGSVVCKISELLANKGRDIERDEFLIDSDGKELTSRLRFTIGMYVVDRGDENDNEEEEEEQEEEDDDDKKDIKARDLVIPTMVPSNCGILEIRSILVQGISPTTTKSLSFCTVALDNDDPCYQTQPSKIGVNATTEWKRPAEVIIVEPDGLDLCFTVKETHGINDQFVDQLKIPFATAQCNEWHRLDGITQGMLKFNATYRPLPLMLEPEVNESGILKVQLLDARELIAVDSNGTSDPFCVLRLNGIKFYKSKVIKKCLAPDFNEEAEAVIKQRDASILQIELKDWNKVSASRTLGFLNLELQNLVPDQWKEMEAPLENVSSGKLHFKIKFVPEQTGKGIRRSSVTKPAAGIISRDDKHVDTEEMMNKNDDTKGDIEKNNIIKEEDENVPLTRSGSMFKGGNLANLPAKPLTTDHEENADPMVKSGSSSLRSSLTPATAAGLKITIVRVEIDSVDSKLLASFDCKLKIKKDGHTIFKTREIKSKDEYTWNESLTVDTNLLKDKNGKLVIQPTWSKLGSDAEFVLELDQLSNSMLASNHDQSESANNDSQLVYLPLRNSLIKATLVVKCFLTMDSSNKIDSKQRRRFSFLGVAK